MQPSPPPVYSMPARSFAIPMWGKLLMGCGVLLALLFVLIGYGITRFFASGRGMLQTEFCMRNLRETQRGLDLYSQDYDQTLPRSAAWMDAVTPFVKNRTDFKCPIVRIANPGGFGYAFNSKVSGTKTSKITSLTTTVLVYDSTDLVRNATDAVTSLPSPPRHVSRSGDAAGKPRTGFNILLYADGHVRYVSLDGASVDAPARNKRRSLFAPAPKTK